MSVHAFSSQRGPILVEAEATGPVRTANLKLVLDTGATTSLINLAALLFLGFDPAQSRQQVQMTTGSGVQLVPVIALTRFSALGHNRFGFSVLAHGLPAATGVDGLLGLDFLRGHVLTVDFTAGHISLV